MIDPLLVYHQHLLANELQEQSKNPYYFENKYFSKEEEQGKTLEETINGLNERINNGEKTLSYKILRNFLFKPVRGVLLSYAAILDDPEQTELLQKLKINEEDLKLYQFLKRIGYSKTLAKHYEAMNSILFGLTIGIGQYVLPGKILLKNTMKQGIDTVEGIASLEGAILTLAVGAISIGRDIYRLTKRDETARKPWGPLPLIASIPHYVRIIRNKRKEQERKEYGITETEIKE